MLDRNIKPEIEVFDTAMIHNAVHLQQKGLLKGPLLFNLVLGVKGSLPATAKNLFFLVDSLPDDAVWSVSVIGPQHVNLSTVALALGGHVRVGIEDNIYYTKGVLATNVSLVERVAAIARSVGRELATPGDVMRIWGI
jgi:3-keto-5-aminohexanoate cleavage enzyme